MPSDCHYTWSERGGLRGTFHLSRRNIQGLDADARRIWTSIRAELLSDDFAHMVLNIFSTHLPEAYFRGSIDRGEFRVYSAAKLLRDRPGYCHEVHVDQNAVVLNMLLYLPRTNTNGELGTELYYPLDAQFECGGGIHYETERFHLHSRIAFKFGDGVCILATGQSFHGLYGGRPIHSGRDLLAYSIMIEQAGRIDVIRNSYRRFQSSRGARINPPHIGELIER